MFALDQIRKNWNVSATSSCHQYHEIWLGLCFRSKFDLVTAISLGTHSTENLAPAPCKLLSAVQIQNAGCQITRSWGRTKPVKLHLRWNSGVKSEPPVFFVVHFAILKFNMQVARSPLSTELHHSWNFCVNQSHPHSCVLILYRLLQLRSLIGPSSFPSVASARLWLGLKPTWKHRVQRCAEFIMALCWRKKRLDFHQQVCSERLQWIKEEPVSWSRRPYRLHATTAGRLKPCDYRTFES